MCRDFSQTDRLFDSLDQFYFRWLIIYPTYINSRKTVADGRRIAKSKVFSGVSTCYDHVTLLASRMELLCVTPPFLLQAVDNPTCNEIHDVLASQGLQVKVEVSGSTEVVR